MQFSFIQTDPHKQRIHPDILRFDAGNNAKYVTKVYTHEEKNNGQNKATWCNKRHWKN